MRAAALCTRLTLEMAVDESEVARARGALAAASSAHREAFNPAELRLPFFMASSLVDRHAKNG